MSTATRRSSFDSLTTAVMEQWLNENSAEDIVFLNTPGLALFHSAAVKRKIPADIVVRLRADKGDGVTSFTYYDTVSTVPIVGNKAARFQPANYSAPVALSWQEEMEYTSDEAIYDAVDDRMQTQLNTIAERLAVDVYKGNTSNAKNILGLEQALPGYNHVQTDGTTAASADSDIINGRYQGRQAANSYGGITRTAWTASSDGTGWTGCAYQHFGTEFAVSSGVPNAGIQRLIDIRAQSSYGMDVPNVMISGYAPWRDYMVAGMSIQEVQKTGKIGNFDIGFDNISFMGTPWFWDDFCKQYNTISAESTSEDSVYFLNLKHLHFCVDSRADMVLTDLRSPVDQHASVKHILWRGQLILKNPRTCARLFNYATS